MTPGQKSSLAVVSDMLRMAEEQLELNTASITTPVDWIGRARAIVNDLRSQATVKAIQVGVR